MAEEKKLNGPDCAQGVSVSELTDGGVLGVSFIAMEVAFSLIHRKVQVSTSSRRKQCRWRELWARKWANTCAVCTNATVWCSTCKSVAAIGERQVSIKDGHTIEVDMVYEAARTPQL